LVSTTKGPSIAGGGEIFASKSEEVVRGWRRLHNEGLRNMYASTNILRIQSRRMRWAGHVTRMGEMINAYKMLVGNPEGKKRPLGSHRCKLKDSIRMDLRGVG
jgi:hypothetical protein